MGSLQLDHSSWEVSISHSERTSLLLTPVWLPPSPMAHLRLAMVDTVQELPMVLLPQPSMPLPPSPRPWLLPSALSPTRLSRPRTAPLGPRRSATLKRLSRRPLPMRGAAKTPLPRSAAHQGNWAMVFIRGRPRPAMAMVDMELELLMVQESMEEAMVLQSMLLQQSRFRLLPRPPAR